MIIALASAAAAEALAQLHATSFPRAWTSAEISALMTAPGGFAVIAHPDGRPGAPTGFLLARAIAGEAEILTLAVAPVHRRGGLAKALVEAAAGAATAAGARTLFLEVAADNIPAIGLYRGAGFAVAGTRRGYYARPGQAAVDALVMRRALNTRPA